MQGVMFSCMALSEELYLFLRYFRLKDLYNLLPSTRYFHYINTQLKIDKVMLWRFICDDRN